MQSNCSSHVFLSFTPELFIDSAINMSLDFCDAGIVVLDKEQRTHVIPVVSAIYDVENLALWRLERTSYGIVAQVRSGEESVAERTGEREQGAAAMLTC